MALTWNWKDKIGTWKEKTGENEYTYNIYSCNGLAVILYEYEENGIEKYQMHGFFLDKDHLKNCLGLNKGYENIYKEYLTEISVINCKKSRQLINEIIKANFDNEITIKITNLP